MEKNINSSDFSYILREIRKYGRIVIFNIYGDWSDKNVKKLDTSSAGKWYYVYSM